jgi:hypothetical protein
LSLFLDHGKVKFAAAAQLLYFYHLFSSGSSFGQKCCFLHELIPMQMEFRNFLAMYDK